MGSISERGRPLVQGFKGLEKNNHKVNRPSQKHTAPESERDGGMAHGCWFSETC